MAYEKFKLPYIDPSKATPGALFHHEMLRIYVDARDRSGYKAIRFLRAVREHGGVLHAKGALARPLISQTGLERLKHEGLLSMSMERLVLDSRFVSLFTDVERAEAARRLKWAEGLP